MDYLENTCKILHKTYNTNILNILEFDEQQFFYNASEASKRKKVGNTTLTRLITNHYDDNIQKPVVTKLSGPMSLSKHSKDDKTIYIIGEYHAGKHCKPCAPNSINTSTCSKPNDITMEISEYLKLLALNTDVFLDIYIEMYKESQESENIPYPSTYGQDVYGQFGEDTSSIHQLIKTFRKCYQKLSKDDVCKNSRIHYTNIRRGVYNEDKSIINTLHCTLTRKKRNTTCKSYL